MSIMRGTKPFPNSFCKRSASACLRTEPNTRNPFEIRTFVVPQPIPVETPVTTTSLLFAIEVLLRGTVSIFIIYTAHLRYYRCQVEEEGRWKFQSPVRSGNKSRSVTRTQRRNRTCIWSDTRPNSSISSSLDLTFWHLQNPIAFLKIS